MKKELIFEGNEKRVYATENPDQVIFHFKDVMVAYNNVKRARLTGKGVVTNKISAFLLGYLNDCGIPTHFIKRIDEREQLCRKIEIIPLEVVVHNRMAGTLAAKLGVEDGFKPSNTIVDLCYNNDELGDPLVNSDQAVALSLASYDELEVKCKLTRTWGDAYGYYLVATGRAEIMIDPYFEIWDAAPLKTVLEEAGGAFCDWSGNATIEGREGCGTNAALKEAVADVLRKYPKTKKPN